VRFSFTGRELVVAPAPVAEQMELGGGGRAEKPKWDVDLLLFSFNFEKGWGGVFSGKK
jgi:hypothetical protein